MLWFILLFAALASASTLATDYAIKGSESVTIDILAALRDHIRRWLLIIVALVLGGMAVLWALNAFLRWIL